MRNIANSGTSYYALLSLVRQRRRNVIPPFASLKHKTTFHRVQLHWNHPKSIIKIFAKVWQIFAPSIDF